MDAKLNELAQNFRRFKAEFIRISSLLPLYQDTPNAAKELSIVIYEHVVLLRVKTEDQDAFERDFFQLKHYYTEVRLASSLYFRKDKAEVELWIACLKALITLGQQQRTRHTKSEPVMPGSESD
ncbi:hypothetical protein M0R45_035177 [Rubus argutus]|uniref:Four helix bundle protein n=1 Tax=Rubus argutus TaxID=59490 RepID=A0AAW1VW28_RUBAR